MDITGIRKALNYLNTEIDRISGQNSVASSSGLRIIKSKEAIMLWVKRGQVADIDKCWYILDGNNQPMYQSSNAVTGILTGLSKRYSSFDEEKGPSLKISFWVQSATDLYRIESGIETTFTKGILTGLCHLPASDTGKVLSIGVEPSKEKSGKGAMVVFGNVYDESDHLVKTEWDKSITALELLDQVALHFGIKITEKDDKSDKSESKTNSVNTLPPKTYEVKGVDVDKPEALRYWYGQLILQCDRLNWTSSEMTEYIACDSVELPLKERSVAQVQNLVDVLKKTPSRQLDEAKEDDYIPF